MTEDKDADRAKLARRDERIRELEEAAMIRRLNPSRGRPANFVHKITREAWLDKLREMGWRYTHPAIGYSQETIAALAHFGLLADDTEHDEPCGPGQPGASDPARSTDAGGSSLQGRQHDLKCWPEFFSAVDLGLKTFEVRKDDRGYRSGDVLLLREWSRDTQQYTGRQMLRCVTYIMAGPAFGIAEGYVCMGLKGPTSLTVAADGTITGTLPCGHDPTSVEVEVLDSFGSMAQHAHCSECREAGQRKPEDPWLNKMQADLYALTLSGGLRSADQAHVIDIFLDYARRHLQPLLTEEAFLDVLRLPVEHAPGAFTMPARLREIIDRARAAHIIQEKADGR